MGTKERFKEHKGRQLKVAVSTPEHLARLRANHMARLGRQQIPLDAEYYADKVLDDIKFIKNRTKKRKSGIYPLTKD